MGKRQTDLSQGVRERLRRLCEELGLTQEEFAKGIGSTRGVVAGGTRKGISVDVAIAAIRKHKLNPKWLLWDEGPMYDDSVSSTAASARIIDEVRKTLDELEARYVGEQKPQKEETAGAESSP